MLRTSKELIFAFVTCIVVAACYGAVLFFTREIPAAGGFYGHTIGVLGFVFMLLTDTLYSLRKRSRSARWGRMADWLQFHIFTGIVGPFMVLLHTSWKFNGLAGVTLLLTGVIVFSGFIGRYIYTRIPRNADGIEDPGLVGSMQASALANARRLMSLWHTVHIPIGMALFTASFVHILGALYYATLLR
ncbi:MAG TPA: hypothetical protein DCG54_12485 [Anaerolineae bacterium]|nr:hypothetical protein [Anaerolineae bacterium]